MQNKPKVHIGSGVLSVLKDIKIIASSSSVVVVTDTNVAKYWLEAVKGLLSDKKAILICIKPGESQKTLSTLSKIWKKMLRAGADRSSAVVTLGGGVVCDIGGLAAATFMRGIPVIHIPTTLLAQTDASIGGKTAIDFYGLKNSIGIFHEPAEVIIDVQTLSTLPPRHIVSGVAEIVKHAIIADSSFFSLLSKQKINELGNDNWITIITKSVAIKQNIVLHDEREKNGLRKQLNFGHTIGHAIEALSLKTKKPLLHGEAIAIGMASEVTMSRLAGLISLTDEIQIISTIKRLGLPVNASGYRHDLIMKYILKDKKNKAGAILWSLPLSIGKVRSDMQLPISIIRKGILAVTQ